MNVTTSSLVNSVGLLMDIVGAILLWRFGLPESLSREGHDYLITSEVNDAEIAKAKRYDRWAHVGLGLLIAGFAFQFVSDFI